MLVIYFIQVVLFIVISGFLILVPGLFLLKKTHIDLKKTESIFLGGVLGFVFTSLLVFMSLIINNLYFLIILLFLINLIYFKESNKIQYIEIFKKLQFLLFKKSLILIFILFTLGVLGQLAIISPSGTIIKGDLVFWSSLGHDGIWHISLIEEIKKWQFPLTNPVFSNTKLYNYHFFSDLLPALFSKLFKFSSLDLFFKFFPLLFSIWLGLGSYIIGKRFGGSLNSGIWAVFFTYFSGSFGYILTFIKDRRLNGEAVFWSSQAQSSSGNPPQIIAFIIVLAIILLISKYFEFKNRLLIALNVLLIGSLIEFKVYGAIIIFLSLGVISLVRLIKDKEIDLLILTIFSSILASILFFPNVSNAQTFLIWEPGWFIRTMIVSTDKLNWLDLELRRQTYLYENNYKRVLLIELIGFLIFLFGNLGTKFVGLLFIYNIFKKKTNYSYQFIFLLAFFALLLPLLFLQKGVAGNTIQFMQYFLLILGIFSGVIISKFFNKIKIQFLKNIIICLIIFLSVPTQIGLLQDFYGRPAFAKVSASELEALNFLKNYSSKTIILSPPYDKYLDTKESTPPIWAWSDTSYISALSTKPVFIADTEQLDIMGYDFKSRQIVQKQVFEETNPQIFVKLLKENRINILYLTNIQIKPKLDLKQISNIKNVYKNNEVEIYQIN